MQRTGFLWRWAVLKRCGVGLGYGSMGVWRPLFFYGPLILKFVCVLGGVLELHCSLRVYFPYFFLLFTYQGSKFRMGKEQDIQKGEGETQEKGGRRGVAQLQREERPKRGAAGMLV